jgi:anthranilate synthase component 2
MILLIDNYDSFVHNLARYVRELGEDAVVRRNDSLTVDDVVRLAPSHLILSPGPCTPAEAGISTELVRRLGPTIPILGVCLGHQCIGAAYGGAIVRADRPMHGKASPIVHDRTGLFATLPSPFWAARYHSLVIAPATLPSSLRIAATAGDDGAIMSVVHREHPVVGVQFHPESALTEYGYAMLDHFLHGERSDPTTLSNRADCPWDLDGTTSSARYTIRARAAAFVPPPVELVR